MLVLVLCSAPLFAQKYSTAIGVRLSRNVYGFTVKQRVFKTYAVEGIMAGGSNEILGTLLLEKHFPVVGRGLNFYIGAGGHLGAIQEFGPTFGADVLMGAEIKVPFLPLMVGADVKPAFHVVHENMFDFNAGISIRYIIGKEDNKKMRQQRRDKKKRKKLKEKVKKERYKSRQDKKEEKLKAKIRKLKGKDDKEEKKGIFEDIHLLEIFKKKPEKDKKKRK